MIKRTSFNIFFSIFQTLFNFHRVEQQNAAEGAFIEHSQYVWLNSSAEENLSLRLNRQKDFLKALSDLSLVPVAKGNTWQRPSREKEIMVMRVKNELS